MPSERDLLITDLSESIPSIIRDAISTGQVANVRGFLAMSSSMWQVLNLGVRLAQLLVDYKIDGQPVPEDLAYSEMTSVNGRDLLQDCIDWKILARNVNALGTLEFSLSPFWDQFINSLDEPDPAIALLPLGQLLSRCSLARHASDRAGKQVGLQSYIPIKYLIVRAERLGGSMTRDEAEDVFVVRAGMDAGRRWRELLYNDKLRVRCLRLFPEVTSNTLVVNPSTISVMRLVINLTNELLLKRYRTI